MIFLAVAVCQEQEVTFSPDAEADPTRQVVVNGYDRNLL